MIPDFHQATRQFPISRESKSKLQLALSKMSKAKVKDTIKRLKDMEYECLEGRSKVQWEHIGKYVTDAETQEKIFKEIPQELRDDFKMAAWCKFCREFSEKYLYSLEKQKKI